MKILDLNITHGIEPVKQSFFFKRNKIMKKVKLNCKVQSYFGVELLKTTLSEIVEEFSPTLTIVDIDCDEDEDQINGFQLSIEYETLEILLKIVAEISRTFEAEQIDAHCDSYGFWIESVIED